MLSVMPTTKTHHPDQFDVDVAQLGTPLDGDQLDAISDCVDARLAAEELLAHVGHMQRMLEAGAPAYSTREQFAVDLDQLADRIHAAVSGLLS